VIYAVQERLNDAELLAVRGAYPPWASSAFPVGPWTLPAHCSAWVQPEITIDTADLMYCSLALSVQRIKTARRAGMDVARGHVRRGVERQFGLVDVNGGAVEVTDSHASPLSYPIETPNRVKSGCNWSIKRARALKIARFCGHSPK
jgi:hypothetical protein